MAYISFQPQDYFNTKLYSGNATDNTAITGVGFTPSFLWGKNRTDSTNHYLIDAVRGVTKNIKSQSTGAEATDTAVLKSFDSDGFTLGDGSLNQSSHTFVTWNWRANGAGVSNTDGSITSTVSASTTSGFSIVTWTGNSGSIGHGLGKKPAMLITKSRGATGGWYTTHKSLSAEMQDNYMFLNDTSANSTNNDIWGGEPTTSTFSVGSGLIGNTTHVAYCFTPIKGFSAMGSYLGNGNADGGFIYTGFSPAFVMIKRINTSENWFMFDNKRSPFNLISKYLVADGTGTDSNADFCDFVSNGYKIKVSNASFNQSGSTYIYLAFASESLVSSNGVPATAR